MSQRDKDRDKIPTKVDIDDEKKELVVRIIQL